jgi:bacillolysin
MKRFLQSLVLIFAVFTLNAQDKFKNPKRPEKAISLGKNLYITPIKTETLKIDWDDNGTPIFIRGKIANPSATNHARGTMEAKVFGYLESIKTTLKIADPQTEFQINTSETDQLQQQHIRMNQFYKGIPVYGGEMILHTDGFEVDKLNGRFYPTPKMADILPTIDKQKALSIAKNDVGKKSILKDLNDTEKSLIKNKEAKIDLVIFYANENIKNETLAWQIEFKPNFVERWEYFIDAKTGAVLNKINKTCALDGPATATATDLNNISRSIKTYQSGSSYILVDASKDMFPGGAINTEDPQGVLWTIDASGTTPENLNVKQVESTNNAWSNKIAVSAHFNAGVAYDYYKKTHNRLSLNGKGGSIISIVNIKETSETTGKVQNMDNAFWNGEFMAYGNGNSFFKPLAGGLDVAGHEMTHGVIENTANLNYQGQSGAINESMADVFGVLIDRQDGDWVVGEDVMLKGPFLRSLSDPNSGDQPASMSQIYTGTEDNGGVHTNSGIPNRAFYLFASTLTGSEEQKKAKAEQVYYRALTKYLTRSSKFIDLRAAIVQACTDLSATVGADAVTAANNAFSAVGIGGSSSTTPPVTQKPVEDLPTNAGNEFILSYDPCEKAIYSSKEIINTEADYHIVVSNVIIDHKPSITDDGAFAYYIAKKAAGGGGTLNRVNLTGTPKVEIIEKTEVWNNVAVSKDGKKLALNTIETTGNDQQRIFVVDLTTGTFYKNTKDGKDGFPLYNPTYSNGVKSAGTPQYSDALEWEYDGEAVIYDAFNQISSNTLAATTPTSTLDYWDVGEILLWNVAKNTFGDGTISKIFTNLAKNESIGNPSLAKKSTSVLAFDHVVNNKYSVLTIDFESKGTDGSYKRSEVANNTVGYPGFSAKDDKLIFNKLVSKQKKCTTDSTNTASISLIADKVTSNGSSNPDFIVTSSLAVWYTVGQRALPTTQSGQIIAFPVVSNKFEGASSSIDLPATTDKGTAVVYKVLSGPASIANGKVVLTGKPGRVRVQGNANATTTATAAESVLDFCVNPAQPVISVTELANAILLQSSDDYTNEWFADGKTYKTNVKGIEITNSSSYTVQTTIDGCKSLMSNAFKAGATEAQTISAISFSDRLQGNTGTLVLPDKTDKGNNITYTVVSGPAIVVGNQLTLTGQPGRVKVKGFSPAGLKYLAAETAFEFCVNPSKPSISITTQPDQYVFKSSSLVGNNWYRNGVALNVTDPSINVVSTNTFTVQVVIDGCKSELSNGVAATKEIVLAEEKLSKAGITAYPNPIADLFILRFSNGIKIDEVSIINLSGIPVYSKNNVAVNELIVDMKTLTKGLYILVLKTNKGEFAKKLMKE